MSENEELDLDLDNQDEALKTKNRFQQLSDKVKSTAKEKDDALAKVKTEEENRLKAEKERDFFRDFSKLSSQYPNATAFQDKILEKVNAGYSAEDATLAILAKEGKLQAPIAPSAPLPDNVAGGSASTAITEQSDKGLGEMTVDEKRDALVKMEKEGINILSKN